MTLIAVWQQRDEILVAGDTGATAPGVLVPSSKVWQIADLPLVWGYSGQVVYAEPLRSRIEAFRPGTWDELRELLRQLAAEANRRARSEAAEAGLAAYQLDRRLVWLVVAGFIDGIGRVLETDTDGAADFNSIQVTYVGSGREGGFLASAVLERLGHPLDVFAMRAVMESVVNSQRSQLAEPIEYWRITAGGAERVAPT